MKKLLLIPLSSIILSACTTTEDFQKDKKSSINQKYSYFKQKSITRQLEKHVDLLKLNIQTRGDSTDYNSCSTGIPYIDDLINITAADVDSIYNNYDSTAYEEMKDSCFYEIYNYLIANSSEEEVQIFINFRNEYILSGGNNLELLEARCNSVSPFIQEFMIGIAATIDGCLAPSIDPFSHESCLEQLVLNYLAGEAEGFLVDETIGQIPTVGVIIELLSAGYDLYESLKLAHEYQQCVNIKHTNHI